MSQVHSLARGARLAASVLAPAAALAFWPAQRLGACTLTSSAYSVSTALPRGRRARYQAIRYAGGGVERYRPRRPWYLLTPGAPDGANGWFKNDVTLTWTIKDAPQVRAVPQGDGRD